MSFALVNFCSLAELLNAFQASLLLRERLGVCRAAFEVSRNMSARLVTAVKAYGAAKPLDLDAVVQVCASCFSSLYVLCFHF